MDDSDFDRLTRRFSGLGPGAGSRRGFLALALGGVTALTRRSASAAQLESPSVQLGPSTCGAAGAVCTLLVGCCEGLTCVTSAINANYGVCMPGDGGTVAVGTTLVSPGSEEIAQEIASGAQAPTTTTTTTTTDTTSTTTTDTQAERDARQTDRDSRKQARQDRQQTRRDTKRANQRSNRLARKARQGPRLELALINAGADGTGPQHLIETVKVTNLDDVSLVLNRVEPLLDPGKGLDAPNPINLDPGRSFLFLSDSAIPLSADRVGWISPPVCSSGAPPGAGILISAGFSADLESFDYRVHCDPSLDRRSGGGNHGGGKHHGHKKRGHGHGKKSQ